MVTKQSSEGSGGGLRGEGGEENLSGTAENHAGKSRGNIHASHDGRRVCCLPLEKDIGEPSETARSQFGSNNIAVTSKTRPALCHLKRGLIVFSQESQSNFLQLPKI